MPTTTLEPVVGSIVTVKVSRIRPFGHNPRKHFDQAKLEQLGQSLLVKQQYPIKVVPVTGDSNFDWEITDGERRWRSAKLVNKPTLKALVEDAADARARFRDSFISNCCREDLAIIEEARAVWKLVDGGMPQEEIAAESGHALSWVSNRMKLRTLQPEVLELMSPELPDEKRMPLASALNLLKLPPHLQVQVANHIVRKKVPARSVGPLVIARNHEAGKGLGIRHVPRKHFERITGMVKRLCGDSHHINTMPSEVFLDTFKSRTPKEVSGVLADIDTAIENLKELRRCVVVATKK